jgi:hypothetical protein
MRMKILFILLLSAATLSPSAQAGQKKVSLAEYQSLEKSHPDQAAKRVIKDLVIPMVRTMSTGGLGSFRVMLSSMNGCMTYPCLKEFSRILKKSGFAIDAQRKESKIARDKVYYLVTLSRSGPNRSPAVE